MGKLSRTLMSVFAVALVSAAGTSASAQSTLYDNDVTTTDVAMNTEDYLWAQDFLLGVPSIMTGVQLALGTHLGVAPSLNWRIFDNAGGTPGALLYSGSTTAVRIGPATSTFCCTANDMYEFNMGTLTFDSGIFWLGVQTRSLVSWLASASSLEGNRDRGPRYSSDDGASWTAHGVEGDFSILGAEAGVVPEPHSLVLVASGLAGVGAWFRRRRRAA